MDYNRIDNDVCSKLISKICDDFNQLYSNKNQIISTIKNESYESFTYICNILSSYLELVFVFLVYKITNIYEKINKLKANNKSNDDLTFCEIKEHINKKYE